MPASGLGALPRRRADRLRFRKGTTVGGGMMCGYSCTGCGECRGKGKRGKLSPRGRCKRCGKQNAPSATTCGACGARLEPYRKQSGIV
ncbi:MULTISPECIES: zinc-ribbon domain-containing protein [Gordonibacter]|uniref:zinc-ribbon domain-containing protein n=1 Tax=Gordonibacter TaxID=644652 RepID=UPI00345E10D5